MVLDRASDVIAKYPAITLVIVLLLSSVFIGFALKNTSFETNEDDFNPDSEIADANNEVHDSFTQNVYYVQAIAQSESGDTLSKETCMDIISFEENIRADPRVEPNLIATTSSPTGIYSLPGIVLVLNDLFTGLEEIKDGLDLINTTMAGFNENITLFIFFLQTQVTNDNAIDMAPTILGFTEQFTEADASALIGQRPVDNRTQREKMDPLETKDIKNLVYDTLNFNKPAHGLEITSRAKQIEEQTSAVNETLFLLLDAVNIIKSYPNASVPVTEDDRSLATILDYMILGLFGAGELPTAMLTQTAFALFDYIDLIGTSLPMLLSNEFDPGAATPDELKCESSVVLIQLDRTLLDVDDGIEIDKSEQAITEISKDANDYSDTKLRVIAAGLITSEIGEGAQSEMARLIIYALILLVAILAITYRSLTDMAVSFIAIILAISWTFGFAAIMDWSFNTILTAVPILIIGLGIDYGIHLTLRYREETGRSQGARSNAVKIAIYFVGSALVLATITTCLSFLSNLTSEMVLIRRFGVLAAVGIVSSFIIMITFVPSAKQLVDVFKQKFLPPKKTSTRKSTPAPLVYLSKLGRGIVSFVKLGAFFAKKSSIGVIIVAVLLTSVSLFGAMQLETRFEFEDFLPEGTESSDNFRYASSHFDISLDDSYIMITAENVAHSDILIAVNDTLANMMDDEYIDTTDIYSILSLIRDVSTDERSAKATDLYDPMFEKMVKNNCSGSSCIPDTGLDEIFAWLYKSPMTESDARTALHVNEDLSSENNLLFDGLLLTMGARTSRVEDGDEILNELTEDFQPLMDLEDDGVIDRAVITGGLVVTKSTMDAMSRSQIRSIGITILVSAIILTLVFFYEKRSFVLGIITTLPIAFVISWIMGGMFLLNYDLNVLTITVGSLTIGLGVTYAIHITHRYVEEVEKQKDVDSALEKTLEHTGLALFGAAATTIGGFIVLMFSTLPPMRQFGTITAMAIGFSMISSIFVLPSMLRIWARLREDKGLLYKEDVVEYVEPEEDD